MKSRLLPLTFVGLLTFAHASTAAFDLDATQVGGYFADGSADNDAVVFQNYYVGYSTSSSVEERRNFFIFDLSTVTAPVSSASLSLTLKFGGMIFGVADYGPSPFDSPTFEVEDFNLSGEASSAYPLISDPFIDSSTAMGYFDTFGDPGSSIGGIGFDPDVPAPPGEIVIDLGTAGVDLINANLGGEIVITGRMLDVSPLLPADPDGGGPVEGEMSEIMWGFTDVFGGPSVTDMPFLTLETVPEPSVFALLSGLLSLGVALNRRRPKI